MSLPTLWAVFPVLGATDVLADKDTAGGVERIVEVGVGDLVTDAALGELHQRAGNLLHLGTW